LSEVKSGRFLFSFLGLEIKRKNQQIIWACLQTVITNRLTERKKLTVGNRVTITTPKPAIADDQRPTKS
jgi:hypothetical protein